MKWVMYLYNPCKPFSPPGAGYIEAAEAGTSDGLGLGLGQSDCDRRKKKK